MVDYKLVFSKKEEYQKIRGLVQENLKQILGENRSFLMEVAVNEAINNAFRSNSTDRQLVIRIRVTEGNRLIIRVKDEGKGFNAKELIKKISNSTNSLFEERLYEESGRGIAIMKVATDKLIYNKSGTEVLMMKFINSANTDKIKREEVYR